ncbi:hypothetical protein EVAR_103532_1 [Eumeta japonica]|uniref:Uncharacterized protein n=1 Tax=Eumeta variegata TaxID=151549 RepID=A0A4C1YS66_EUMVA|nr:hypothetical protein EVAR_103532_1 [Eumeta japonica]
MNSCRHYHPFQTLIQRAEVAARTGGPGALSAICSMHPDPAATFALLRRPRRRQTFLEKHFEDARRARRPRRQIQTDHTFDL